MTSTINKTSISVIVRKLKELIGKHNEALADGLIDEGIVNLSVYLFSLLPTHKKHKFKKNIDQMQFMIDEIPRIEKDCHFCTFARKDGKFAYYCSRYGTQVDKGNGCENFSVFSGFLV